MGVDLSFGVATDPSQRVPVLQRMIANNSIQQHIVCVSLSLVVCVSVLSVCSRVSCGFVGLDGVEVVAVGGRSRVAGAWLRCACVCLCVFLFLFSFVLLLMCSLSLCVLCLASRLVSSCLVLSCVLSCLVCCVVLSSLFVREWSEIFGFVSKRTTAKAFAKDVFIDQERR